MHSTLLFAAIAPLVGASVTQQQLPFLNDQVSINSNADVAGKKLVSSKALQDDVSSKNLLNGANALFEIAKLSEAEYNHPTRVIGSEGHLATIDYIYSTIAKLGDYYTLSNQSFPVVTGNVFESRLVLGDLVPKTASPMGLTPPTKNRDAVFGPLVLVDNSGCEQSDYPSSLQGGIAFIKRGVCSFGDKSALAGKNGAIAAVVYNNDKGSLQGTLGDPTSDHVATFGISYEEATPLIEKLEGGSVIPSSAYIDAIVGKIATTNIIAQTKEGDAENCVMLGGHSDSVAKGPGINDNGSGSLTLLEVATQLAKYSVNNCVRFAWFAAEEEGLLGSDWYVDQLSDEENLKIRLFMDYDMMASPNYAYQVYNGTNALNPTGSEELRDLYVNFYKTNAGNCTFTRLQAGSDYDAFIKNGIPGGGIATGAGGVKTKEEADMFGGKAGDWYDPCYHQLCDTVDNVNLEAWELNTKLVAHSVATYAISFDGFPKRSAIKSAAQTPSYRYHGSKLVI